MSETSKAYTRKRVAFLVLLMFFTCVLAGINMYYQKQPLATVLISWMTAFVIGLVVMVIVIKRSKPRP